VPDAVRERDLRDLGWWLAEHLIDASIEPPYAGPLVSLMRVLFALGPGDMAEAEVLREVELRGRLAHGLAPRDPDEWERAAAVFSAEALEEFARWAEGEAEAPVPGGDGDGGWGRGLVG
jgi:hypothetical protein